jgi:hypothetical protein
MPPRNFSAVGMVFTGNGELLHAPSVKFALGLPARIIRKGRA